jgi:hypothetical protein
MSRTRRIVMLAMLPFGVVIGVLYGWRYVFAPLLGFAVLSWAIASLRVLVQDAADDDGQPPVDEGPERTVFSCSECGTEVLLLYRGTSRAPSHCGQRMTGRIELVR